MTVYLTIPISLPGDEGKRNIDKQVPCKILPSQIYAYHQGYAWGTFIYLSTGQAFCCTLTVEEFEKAIRGYWEALGKDAVQKIKTLN